jgi:hypothetical protein
VELLPGGQGAGPMVSGGAQVVLLGAVGLWLAVSVEEVGPRPRVGLMVAPLYIYTVSRAAQPAGCAKD